MFDESNSQDLANVWVGEFTRDAASEFVLVVFGDGRTTLPTLDLPDRLQFHRPIADLVRDADRVRFGALAEAGDPLVFAGRRDGDRVHGTIMQGGFRVRSGCAAPWRSTRSTSGPSSGTTPLANTGRWRWG